MIVSVVLPRDFSPGIRRNKIILVHIQIKYTVGEINNNNITYIDPGHTGTTSTRTLNMNLYYKDNLHLIKKGNEKLAKAITTAFNVRSLKRQQQNPPDISQQQQQERPQHQQKRHQNQQ